MRPMSFRSITLRHLRRVSALGKELNTTRSAELLHSTQPALSGALAEIDSAQQGLAGIRTGVQGGCMRA